MSKSESPLRPRRHLSFLGHFDLPLIAVVLCLAGIGLTGVYSATLHGAQSNLFVKQIVWICAGTALFLFLNLSDYRFPTDHAFAIYAAAVLSLVAVLAFGTEVHGSRSWIRVGGVGFQPSEFAKVAVVLVLARYLAGQHEDYLSKTRILTLTGLALCPAVLVMMQGDLGTALTYFPILMGTMFVAGMRLRRVFQAAILSLVSAPFVWFALKDYQQQRILVTLNPSLDPQGVGYQTSQSIIAVGSSGLAGKGFGQGFQSQLGFVPEIHSDFVYALLTEEWGLLGGGLILSLYLLLFQRLAWIGGQARDRSGILIVTGVASLIGFHVMVNVGMSLGICPPIGIPLPLLSYGGSATVGFLICLGLAASVYSRRFIYSDP